MADETPAIDPSTAFAPIAAEPAPAAPQDVTRLVMPAGFLMPGQDPPRGSILHTEQTTKQPLVWRCGNPACIPANKHFFDFQSDYPECPKCKSVGWPNVTKRSLTHFLVPDPKGKIEGQHGNYRMACDATRDQLATPLNGEAATNLIYVANCPGCLKAVAGQMLAPPEVFTAASLPGV